VEFNILVGSKLLPGLVMWLLWLDCTVYHIICIRRDVSVIM
jgi:hypothetical protein